MSRRSSVCILVAPRWLACVWDSSTIVQFIAIWVSLRVYDMLVGFMLVYASTNPSTWVVMWIEIVDHLRVVDLWIVGRDFNNVETAADVCSTIPPHLTIIFMRECDSWDMFIFTIHGVDARHEPSFAHSPCSLDFTWGFRRQGAQVLERLDRFYVDVWAAARGVSVCIWSSIVLLDHVPISLKI